MKPEDLRAILKLAKGHGVRSLEMQGLKIELYEWAQALEGRSLPRGPRPVDVAADTLRVPTDEDFRFMHNPHFQLSIDEDAPGDGSVKK